MNVLTVASSFLGTIAAMVTWRLAETSIRRRVMRRKIATLRAGLGAKP